MISQLRLRRLRRPALYGTALLGLWFAIHTVVIVADGLLADPRPADVAVVLGNKVEPSGVPSEHLRDRLDRAVALYRAGTVRYVIASGGLGREGHEEASVMAAYLREHGVRADRVLEDRDGWTTLHTARNAKQIMHERGWASVVVVSTYYHVTRCKLAFARVGVENVSAASARFNPGRREPWSLVREFAGFYYYLLHPLD